MVNMIGQLRSGAQHFQSLLILPYLGNEIRLLNIYFKNENSKLF